LQGGIGTLAFIEKGLRADYFVNSEPTDLAAPTMHAAAFTFIIELTGKTRHMSKREESVDVIAAACDLIPRLNAMKFSGAPSPEHESINRAHVGVLHGALGKELHEWRPPQVSDFVRLKGSGRYAPGQTEDGALADLRAEPDRLDGRHHSAGVLRHPRRPPLPQGRHGRHRVRPGRALQHHARRARRHRQLYRHDQDLYFDYT
jgi:acetylornithine deacetylase